MGRNKQSGKRDGNSRGDIPPTVQRYGVKTFVEIYGGIQAQKNAVWRKIKMSQNGVCDGDALQHSRTTKCCPKKIKNTEGIWRHWSDSGMVRVVRGSRINVPLPLRTLVRSQSCRSRLGKRVLGSVKRLPTGSLLVPGLLPPPRFQPSDRIRWSEAHPRIMR